MPTATFHFPRGFLWGTATSAHQVEGNNNNNNWSAWEKEPGRMLNNAAAGLACDWWNGGRWREDFDRASEIGTNAHRLSVEWSRIQPASDRWDEDAIDRYRQMIQGLGQRGITPMVTLHHFTNPLWLETKGGWENEEIIPAFVKFVRKVVEALSPYCSLWCTINEPNVYATMGYVTSEFPPGKSDIKTALLVAKNMVKAHAAAYKAIHDIQNTARVGPAPQYRGLLPRRSWLPPEVWVANFQSNLFNNMFTQPLLTGKMPFPARERIPEAKGTLDFIGINYYTIEQVSLNLLKPDDLFSTRGWRKGAEVSGTGFAANEPEGMFQALKWGRQFNVPMIITENGIEDAEDTFRRKYLLQHIHQVWRAVNFNWPVKGYFHWSLIDNFEWERGWSQRYGLWEVDPETQVRRKRPSADMYAEIIKENGISSDIVARYSPDLLPILFP
jgi:beta-glucosidase